MEEKVGEILRNLQLEDGLIKEILTSGRKKRVEAEESVVVPGSSANEVPFVIEGLLRVMRQDSNGNEIFLYYLEGGETCAMSITCCLENRTSSFHVAAETDALLWMIPAGQMDGWITKYKAFRRFVFDSYQTRFDELMQAIDSMAFMKMDERLYKFLLDSKQASGSFTVNKTHEQIANELNTSRVVISRLVKKLEREGKIEQYRNRIEIL